MSSFYICMGDQLLVEFSVAHGPWTVERVEHNWARPGESEVHMVRGGDRIVRRWWWLQKHARPVS